MRRKKMTSGRAGRSSSPAQQEGKPGLGDLQAKYSVGRVLGRGAFGVVCLCTRRSCGRDFAVKHVGKHQSVLNSPVREVGMLRRLAHPSVVKLHEVCADAQGVYMVFSLYRGGDMIAGMERHWRGKGQIPMAAVQNMARQMFRSLEWIHQNNVVHRDVKADNFLLDHEDLAHPACRAVLADFGVAAELRAGERLERRVGTNLYWAPEVYARNYAFKVDVWAAGVVAYGLVAGDWPFKGEEEVQTRSLDVPSRCGTAARSLLLRALARSEDHRLSAREALRHPFLASGDCAALAPGAGPGVAPSAMPRLRKAGPLRVEVTEKTTAASSDSDREREAAQRTAAAADAELAVAGKTELV